VSAEAILGLRISSTKVIRLSDLRPDWINCSEFTEDKEWPFDGFL